MADSFTTAFTPFQLGPITLRNRFIRTGAFEGMSQGGEPTDRLVEHHRRVAQGGVAMTTVAYCSVSPEGRTYDTQLLMDERIVPGLRRITDAVHREGALASIQLGHCGDFAEPAVIGAAPVGPSKRFNLYSLSFSRTADEIDLERICKDFESATTLAIEAGFDAVEIHGGHGYLLSQFISPFTNKRQDSFGGSLENRLRFPLRVLRTVKEVAKGRAAVLVKMNLDDGFPSGLPREEAVECALAFYENGADAIVTSGGFVSKAPLYMLRGEVPTRDMVKVQTKWYRKLGLALFGRLFVPKTSFEENFFMEQAGSIRQMTSEPIVLLGGIVSKKGVERAIEAGFQLLAVGRATIHDPDFVNRLRDGTVTRSECDQCNRCIAAMDAGGVKCVCAEEGALESAT